MPIDYLLQSIATECKERGIGIILSGTGSDGSLGLRDIKGAGGLVMAEEPASAEYDGMPSAAVDTGLVDFVCPVEELPQILVEYVRQPYVTDSGENIQNVVDSDLVQAILQRVRRQIGYDFSGYKKGTLTRRIHRRLGINRLKGLGDYLEFLDRDSGEVDMLFRDLLICVTSFFRNKPAWESLENTVIPKIVGSKSEEEDIRVWVPGCGTGEEAYSVAMALEDRCNLAGKKIEKHIFASDINDVIIEKARTGRYPLSIAADISSTRLSKYFAKKDEEYLVDKKLREAVIFARQDLICDPPFSNLDLICCRNLLIYLEPEIQVKVIRMFHYALAEDGFLFLGNSETIGEKGSEYFEPLDKEWRIFRKKRGVSQLWPSFPLSFPDHQLKTSERISGQGGLEGDISEVARQALLKRYVPASVLINRNYDILYFHGPTREYLDFPTGEPTRDLADLCLSGMESSLRSAVYRALATKSCVSVVARRVVRNGKNISVKITVEPVDLDKDLSSSNDCMLVSFEEDPGFEEQRQVRQSTDLTGEENEIVARLEYELQVTREDLHSSVEEMETSNEELKASNEEVMSINEELQSTNEELETSREELQSLNEELSTVNGQLEEKLIELETTNSDLVNLLGSTDIATVFLDPDLCIRRFNSSALELVRLIPADLGRHFSDIVCHFEDKALLSDARDAMERQVSIRKEIRTDSDKYFIRKASPCRTPENKIEGVVITFSDISEIRKQTEMVKVRERQQAVVAMLGRKALGGASLDELFDVCCRESARVLGVPFTKLLEFQPDGRRLLLREGVGWRSGLVGREFVEAGRGSQAGYTIESAFPVIVEDLANEKRFRGSELLIEHGVVSGMSVIIGEPNSPWGVFGAHTRERREFTVDDINFMESMVNLLAAVIHERDVERSLKESENRYRLITESLPILISYCSPDYTYQYCNSGYEDWFGTKREEIIGQSIESVIGKKPFEKVKPSLDEAFAGNRSLYEGPLRMPSGKTRQIRVEYIPEIEHESVRGVYVMVQDVTAQARIQTRLEHLSRELLKSVDEKTEELRILTENVPAYFAFVDSDLRYRFVNRLYEERFNLKSEEVVGRPFEEMFSESTYRILEPNLRKALEGETVEFEVSLDIVTDGTRVVRARYMPRRESGGEISGVFVLADDITEERRLQQEVLSAAEEEKAKIGRDIHDSICQELAGIGMMGRALATNLSRESKEPREDVEELIKMINKVTHESRLLARGVSPVVLENRTLSIALQELLDSISSLYRRVTCDFDDAAEDIELSESVATQLYFISREAIFNAARHSGTREIFVSISIVKDDFVVSIRDRGKGKIEKMEEGMGMRSMRYRARTLGANLSVENNQDSPGVIVSCSLPLRHTR